MRNAVATIVVVLLCRLALAPCVVVQASRKQQRNTVDDTKQDRAVGLLLVGSSWPDLDAAEAFENRGQVGHRRSLKKAKVKASQSKKKGSKWAKGKATLWGLVIGVAIFVAVVAVCTLFLLITEKKEQHPKWQVRDLIKRRVKPGVTRAFTRKKPAVGDDVDDMEAKKMRDDPPKLQGSEAGSIS